jgi:hypothetical protein
MFGGWMAWCGPRRGWFVAATLSRGRRAHVSACDRIVWTGCVRNRGRIPLTVGLATLQVDIVHYDATEDCRWQQRTAEEGE